MIKKILQTFLVACLSLGLAGCFNKKEEDKQTKMIYCYTSYSPKNGFILEIDEDGDTLNSITYIRTFTGRELQNQAEAMGKEFDEVYEEMYNVMYNQYMDITSGTLENYPFFECSLSTLKVSKDIQSRYTFVTGNEDLLKYMKEGNKTLINTLKELGLYESYSTEANRFSYKRLKASTAYTNMNIDSQKKYNEELEGELWP